MNIKESTAGPDRKAYVGFPPIPAATGFDPLRTYGLRAMTYRMRSGLIAAPLLVLSASGAVAADMLPLIRGIYVVTGTPCKRASNVDTLSYWGKDNGINASKVKCRIIKLAKKGATYSLRRACTEIQFDGRFNDEARITIHSQTSFTTHGLWDRRGVERTYRYCGPKVQF